MIRVEDVATRPDLRGPALRLGFVGGEFLGHGWDSALVWAAEDHLDGTPPTTLVALEVYVEETARGQGIAGIALADLKDRARRAGLGSLVVPVRPTGKPPLESIVDYLVANADPWLRSHERLGARFRKIAPFAMTVTGSFTQWEAWTGVRLEDGPNVVPGGIAPVFGSAAQDLGVYVEPNVWYEHPL